MKRQWFILAGLLLLIAIGFVLPTPMREGPSSLATTQSPSEPIATYVSKGDYFTSAAGIVYGKDRSGKFESRVAHIMAHTQPDDSKPKHSMFIATAREDVLALLDEAWKKRGPPERQGGARGRDVYDVPMGRVIGTNGEQRLRMVVEKDSAVIVTAYPVR
jgi:hypothetical protein